MSDFGEEKHISDLTTRIDGVLKKDEIELLRALLAALTKLVNVNDSDLPLSNTSETNSLLIFLPNSESDVESVFNDYSVKKGMGENVKEKVAEMRVKHETFLKLCDDLEYGLGHLISSFLSVGGTRSVIRASMAMRTFLHDFKRHSQEWIPCETQRMKALGTVLHKTLSALAEASLDLSECLVNFESYHGLPLQEFQDWEWCLRGGVITIVRLLNEKDYKGLNFFVFESLMPGLSVYMDHISQKLKALVSLTLPPIQSAENNAISRYLNMTTIATFFSGVTATTLQFSYSQTETALNDSVNLFWLLSLVFSVSSAINSLLGMTWRKSSIAPPTFRLPLWAVVWLDIAPMLFLFISAFTFAIGLAIFSFASRQHTLVSVLVTTFIVLHILGLFILSIWFLTEVEKDDDGFLRRFFKCIFCKPFRVFVSTIKRWFLGIVKRVRDYTNRGLKTVKTANLRFCSGLTTMESDLEAAKEQTDEGRNLASAVFQSQGVGALQFGVQSAEKADPKYRGDPDAIIDQDRVDSHVTHNKGRKSGKRGHRAEPEGIN